MATEVLKSVALMDASFQFGDVGVLLNMNPKNKSIADVLADVTNGDIDAVDTRSSTTPPGWTCCLHRPARRWPS